ncbi:MAG: DUF2807 domain-containing protein [bacterium]|nr:DUF2807 domain-containing protein [bacterium]
MYKVININIGGRIFQIEESAFETLSQYINSLKQYFSSREEGAEIVSDIESRIAELLQSKLNVGEANINSLHVTEIIASIGSPKDIAGDDEPVNENKQQNHSQQQSQAYQTNFENEKSKVFRDPDGKIVSGVCSGLAYYFNIDPILMRLIFVALFFAGGSSILIYIILIVVIPVARTTAEKLAMRKEKINLDTIQKSVENEFNKIKETFENRNFGSRLTNFIRKVFNVLGQILTGVFTIALKFLGIFFGIIALILIVAFFVAATGNISIDGHSSNIANFISMKFFENTNDSLLGHTVIIFTIFSLMLMFFYWSSAILTNGNVFNKRKLFSRTIGVLWLLTIVLFLISAARSAAYFRTKSSIEKTITLDSSSNNFVITSIGDDADRDWFILKNDELKVDDIELSIEETDGPSELVQVISAYGQDAQKAKMNAANCVYKIEIKDSFIILPEVYVLPKNKTYRKQKIRFVLKLHKGIHFRIDKKVNIEIDGNTLKDEGIYAGNKYAVVENGIECDQCLSSDTYNAAFDYNRVYKVAAFNKIIVSNNISVNISKGDENSIHAKVKDNDHLIVEEDNGVLKIRLKKGWFSNTDNTVQVSVICQTLDALDISGVVEATVDGFHNNKMIIKCSGASSCKAKLNPNSLSLFLSGVSNFNIEGECNTMEVKASGASTLNAAEFLTQTTTVVSSGTSQLEVNAKVALTAKSSGASKIEYLGEPLTTKLNCSGVAEITKK